MIVFHDGNLRVGHVVGIYHPDFLKLIQDGSQGPFVIVETPTPSGDIDLARDDKGRIVAKRKSDGAVIGMERQPMPLVIPPACRVGQEAAISGIPEGAKVVVNGAALLTMDSTGVLEFTPRTAGRYEFRFVADGFIDGSVSLEAVA